jgi:O-acetylhomoserine/O-acetylserine sulfhydrylase-like pyridoxal-dependent enzyme
LRHTSRLVPGLPLHQLALKTLRKDTFGGMLTFHVEGGFEQVKKVIDNLKLASHLANLGVFRSCGVKPLRKT